MLRSINILYIGSRVLILLELSYLSRFCTLAPPPSPPMKILCSPAHS